MNSLGSLLTGMFDEKNDGMDIERLGLSEDEYIKDNTIYCKKCNTHKSTVVEIFNKKRIVRCICECRKKEMAAEKEREERMAKMIRLESLQTNSLMGEKYKKVRFDDTIITHNDSFKVAYNRCKKYCENSKEVILNGYGIYIYGNPGCGKTHLTACMANDLLSKYVEVVFTNFFEISKEVRSAFNSNNNLNEKVIINKYKNAEILFIDDLGTESLSKNDGDNYLQNLMFEIINARYNNNKATIFTSNYSLKELITDRKIEAKTVDRIRELSNAILYIDGNSYRGKAKEVEIPF